MGSPGAAMLLRGATGSFLVMGCGVAVTYALQILMARVMGGEQYGIYATVFAWVALLSMLSVMGWNTALLRFSAASIARKEWGALRGLLHRSGRFVLVSSLAFGAVLALTVWLFRFRLSSDLLNAFLVAAVVLPFISFLLLKESALRGVGRPVLASAVRTLIRPAVAVVVVLLICFYRGRGFGAPTGMAVLGASFALAVLMADRLLKKAVPGEMSGAGPVFRTRAWVSFALPAFGVSGSYIILQQTDRIMIGMLVGTTEAGIYDAAAKSSMLMSFGLTAVNSVLAPMASSLYSTGRMTRLQGITKVSAWIAFLFCFVSGGVLFFFGDSILGLFGREFRVGYSPLIVLAAGQTISALAGPVGMLMLMADCQKMALVILILSVLLNAVLNLFLIPRLGIEGAAWASMVTMFFWCGWMLVYILFKVGINPTVFSFSKGGNA